MKKLNKIRKNETLMAGILYMFGNMFNKAIAFITVPIFTRILTTHEFGIINTYLSWVTVMSLIVGLSLGNSIRNAIVDYKDDINNYLSSIFFLSIVNFIIISSFVLLMSKLFLENINIILIVLCLIQSYMTFVINSISIKYMMRLEYIKNTLLLSIPNLIITILSVVFILYLSDDKYMGRIFAYVLVNTLISLTYLVIIFKNGPNFINKKYWNYSVSISTPLIFHGLSMTILVQSDQIMITFFRNAAETGIYSLIVSLGMVLMAVQSTLENLWIPWFTKKMIKNNDKKEINNVAKYYIEIMLIATVFIMFISPEVVKVIAPKEYWTGISYISPIFISTFVMFLYSLSVNLEYYYKSTRKIAMNTFIAACTNIILNLIFIPFFGAIAAAFSTLLSYFISFLLHYKVARKLDSDLFPFNIYLKPLILIIIAGALFYPLINWIILRWSIATIGLVAYMIVIYRNGTLNILLRK